MSLEMKNLKLFYFASHEYYLFQELCAAFELPYNLLQARFHKKMCLVHTVIAFHDHFRYDLFSKSIILMKKDEPEQVVAAVTQSQMQLQLQTRDLSQLPMPTFQPVVQQQSHIRCQQHQTQHQEFRQPLSIQSSKLEQRPASPSDRPESSGLASGIANVALDTITPRDGWSPSNSSYENGWNGPAAPACGFSKFAAASAFSAASAHRSASHSVHSTPHSHFQQKPSTSYHPRFRQSSDGFPRSPFKGGSHQSFDSTGNRQRVGGHSAKNRAPLVSSDSDDF
ncbi:hypothetical protein WR25_05085 isoform B [Diploscapter pachys]|uniref:Uncharacterized protein n=1 Tax=Diploscapter pachys TaxID=2018661 RepID=A0A2A2K3F2_9BILA|nr:hypothetical protein WR25_05085 isoform B [Diploscapter pachys]